MTLDSIHAQIKKIDEYEYFKKIISIMNSQNSAKTKKIINSLDEKQQGYLKEVLQSKRITIEHQGTNTTVARRIIKPKKHSHRENPSEMH